MSTLLVRQEFDQQSLHINTAFPDLGDFYQSHSSAHLSKRLNVMKMSQILFKEFRKSNDKVFKNEFEAL